jgi:hypothetical protein
MLNHRHRWRDASALALLAGVLAVVLAACGSSSTGSGGGTSSVPLKSGESPTGQKLDGARGGVLKVYDHEDFEHLDPGEAYGVEDYTIMSASQRPLYS